MVGVSREGKQVLLPVSVLVVADDEQFSRIAPLLEADGPRRLDVTRVAHPDEAQEAVQALVHDLCVVMRPPGDAAAEWVRCAREAGTEVPVVVLGEQPDPSVEGLLADLGATEYLPLAGLTREAFHRVLRYALEHAQSRETLRQAIRENAQLTAALAALPLGVAVTDPRLPGEPILFVNPAFERITGYAAGEVLGRSWAFLAGPDTDAGVLEELRAGVDEERPVTRQLLQYRRDGRPFWSEVRLTPIRNTEGAVGHVVALFQDVTAEREREHRLGRNERCVSRLVEQLDDAAAIFQEDVLVHANPALARLLAAGEGAGGTGPSGLSGLAGRAVAELAQGEAAEAWRAAHAAAPPCGTPVRRRLTLGGPGGAGPVEVEVESSLVSYQGAPAVLDVLRRL